MDIQYQNTMDDLVALHLYNSQRSASSRLGRLLLQLVVGSITLASSALYFVAAEYLEASIWLVAGLLLVALVPRSFRWSVERQALKLHRRSQKTGALGLHRLSLTAEAMVDTTDRGERQVLWTDVERVVSTSDHVFILTAVGSAAIVPKTAFSDDAGCADFIQSARNYLGPTVA